MDDDKKIPKLPRGNQLPLSDAPLFDQSHLTFTVRFRLETGDYIAATGTIAKDNTVELDEVIGLVTEDNIDEILEKFREGFMEELKGLH